MKASVLTTGILAVALTISVAPMDSPAEGSSQSNGTHQAKGHYESGVVGQSVLNYEEFCFAGGVQPIPCPNCVVVPPIPCPDCVVGGDPPTPCPDSVPYATTVLVYTEEGELVAQVRTDEEGYFKVSLNPGIYHLTAYTPPPPPNSVSIGYVSSMYTFVKVQKHQFAPAYVFSASFTF